VPPSLALPNEKAVSRDGAEGWSTTCSGGVDIIDDSTERLEAGVWIPSPIVRIIQKSLATAPVGLKAAPKVHQSSVTLASS